MSTTVWPPIAPDELRKAEDESLARELEWLVESLQETLETLKSGLEECYALLAPVEPGSTLVISSSRSEFVKGHVTRVGTRVVKGSLHLKLRTLPAAHLALNPDQPLILTPLVHLRSLLNQCLDCVDITRWTGPRTAPFLSAQLRLLHSLLSDARSSLRGTPLLGASSPWIPEPLDPNTFAPALPPTLALDLTIHDAALVLVVRSLEPADQQPGLTGRFALAIGAQRRELHDEADRTFVYAGREVRVREKVRVESADPSLMAAMAKLTALEYTAGVARRALGVVMGDDVEDLV